MLKLVWVSLLFALFLLLYLRYSYITYNLNPNININLHLIKGAFFLLLYIVEGYFALVILLFWGLIFLSIFSYWIEYKKKQSYVKWVSDKLIFFILFLFLLQLIFDNIFLNYYISKGLTFPTYFLLLST